MAFPNSIDAWLLRRWAYWARPVGGVATDAGELNRQFVTLQMMLDRSRLTNAKSLLLSLYEAIILNAEPIIRTRFMLRNYGIFGHKRGRPKTPSSCNF